MIDQMHHMSQLEILAAIQACMIYLIMCIIDHSFENAEHGNELLQALFASVPYLLCPTHQQLICERTSTCASKRCIQDLAMKLSYLIQARRGKIGSLRNLDEGKQPQFSCLRAGEPCAECCDLHRLCTLWLLVGCVVCVKTGIPCDTSHSYRQIPLPSSKSLWEARTQSAWEAEYEANRMLQMSGLVNLGHLIDLQRSQYTAISARKLDLWNASIDNLGSLLNLVVTMV